MKRITIFLVAITLAACSSGTQESSFDAAADDQGLSAAALAVASESRPDADRDRDEHRKPAEVLEFLGVEPGMTVLDMYSGGGYYTEILSRTVGPEGRVLAHSNEAYLQFVGEEFEQRYLDGRLANARVLMAENNELALDHDTLDAVMLVLSFHDLYYVAPENGWPEVNVGQFLAELRKGLKPGGFVAVIDHYATDGAPRETGGTLHRIDPAIVVEDMTAAGFKLDGQIDILRNPDDDHSRSVFDPDLRGRTDRFVMRFRNPE